MIITKKDIELFTKNRDFSKYEKEIAELPKASFLFTTYNRCPYKDYEQNPLVWAFQTLIHNKYYKIDDFVVIDDCSSDYTYDSIKWLQQTYNISINYIKQKEKKECSYNKRVGLLHTKYDLVFLGDDDCLYNEYFLVGGLLTYYFLKKQKPQENLAVLSLTTYEKMWYPKEAITISKMGVNLLEKTYFYYEYNKFPEEYIKHAKYLDDKKIILKPFEVDIYDGVNLSDKRLVIKAGNYPDMTMWKFGHADHLEISTKIKQMNFSIYHQPDPVISCVHLKYGNKSRDLFDKRHSKKRFPGVKYNLGELVTMSQKQNFNTGTRSPASLFHTIEIGTFFSYYLKLSDRLGLKFIENEYKLFVEDGFIGSTTPSEFIKSKRDRHNIFINAIMQGVKASEIQTGKDYSALLKKALEILSLKEILL